MENMENRDELTIEQEMSNRFNSLVTLGKQVEATSKILNINKQPSYLNLARFKKAQLVCQKYFTNISFGSSTGLLLLVQLENILVPLLKTGKSRTVSDLYDRYVATAKYIRKCYETDFYDSKSEGWSYINIVRCMHQRIHTLMNENSAPKKVKSNVWVNQYDMAVTQFAFIGLFLLKPNKCGAYHLTKEELADVAYYWRLISYYLGIEERFNIFVYDDNLEKQLLYMNKIREHINEMLIQPRNRIGKTMSEGIMFAFEDFSTDSSLNILDHWWSPYISISGQEELEPYTLSDRWKLIFFLLYFKILFRNETILSIVNFLYKRKFDKFCAGSEKIKAKLAKKYKDHICELDNSSID